jgi:DNA-binding SARP family transcriptional activator/DNA-binding beta-propeller fold protein YncE
MEFRILGPLEVAKEDGAILPEAPKQRALLGVLLLHPNEVVSSDRLIDELWGESPPATAAKLVHTYVSQLRRALGDGVIATRPPGYVLLVEEDTLDAGRFRRLAAEGRRLAAKGEPEPASTAFLDALALWRGPPLAGVVFESFAQTEVERLEEERLETLMGRIDCELELGKHDELVAEVETLVRQHPLRERLRAQLMLALYRSGRQADALAAYQDARRILVEQLGLEPGRELQELEKAILTHDAAVDAPRQTAPTRPVRRLRPWHTLAAATLVLLALSLGFAFALRGGQPAPKLLAPNSVGFIDLASGRVTRSYPVGREPLSLALAFHSVWVANYRDETVTRLDLTTGSSVFIDVRAHPTGLAALGRTLWVWTIEGLLVPIDPRFDRAAAPIDVRALASQSRAPREMAAGGGFLWVTAPPTTVIRVNPTSRQPSQPIIPDAGAHGAIAFQGGEAWVAGANQVFPIAARTGIPGSGITVGSPVLDLAPSTGSLWVISGAPAAATTHEALRRIDLRDRLVRTTIRVGSDPVAVAAGGGSIWAASGSDGTIDRVDPAQDGGRVVDTIQVGASPTALAADEDGVWVAVR